MDLIKALFDKGAWLLMLPCALILLVIDPPMALTVGQWLLVAPILAGLAVIVSRIMFPKVSIPWLVAEIKNYNVAAGVLAAAFVLFVGMVFVALCLWAKA